MDIEVRYWGRPSEFFPTLFKLDELESFLDITIITETITAYGVHPTTATGHVKRQDIGETYIGTIELDYLVLHGGLTKDFLDLAWCIDRAKSKQAGHPITINPALLFQAPTPPVSGDEESDEEGGIDSREASPVEREATPPFVAANEPREDEIVEVTSDEEEIEEENSSFETRATLEVENNAEHEDELETDQEPEAGVTREEEYEENEGGDIHDNDESQSIESSPDDKEEDLNAQIASMQLIISELRQDRRERQNLKLAIKQLEELQNKVKNHTSEQRKSNIQLSDTSTATKKPEIARGKSPGLLLQMFPDAGKIPSVPSTPSTPQGNKRKTDANTPPFSSPNKRVKTQETGDFGTNRHTSPHTPPRDLEYSEDEDEDDEDGDEETVNYSADDDSGDTDEDSVDGDEDEDSGDDDEDNDDDDFGAIGGKTLLPPSDDDGDSEEDEDDGYPATGGKTTALPPVKPQRAGAFSPAEHNALHGLIVNLRVDEQNRGLEEKDRLKDTKLYAKLSTQMNGLGYNRSAGSCKNYWNRYGRALSGYDERIGKIKNTSLVTSAQN